MITTACLAATLLTQGQGGTQQGSDQRLRGGWKGLPTTSPFGQQDSP